jgi:AcrR family transcriptional regulator
MDRRSKRPYRLGKRVAEVERTRAAIVAAAHDLVTAGAEPSVAAVAARAGVARLTVYNRFGSKSALLGALAERSLPVGPQSEPPVAAAPRDALRQRINAASALWASDPLLFRRLHAIAAGDVAAAGENRALAERLANADELRPGCSIKEAEDVLDVLTSFATFDRLQKDGRRSSGAVGEILGRLAGSILRDRDT